jgi:hypothetical protein
LLPERLNEQNYFLIKYYYSVVLIVSTENANSDIKSELHKLIDEIEDQEALNLLREDAAAYAVKKKVQMTLLWASLMNCRRH